MPGPADFGVGVWPHMDFRGLEDGLQRAACEFLQEIVLALEDHLAPRDQVQRHEAPSRRELAARAEIGHDSLNDILLGRVWPRSDRLARLAAAAGVTVGVL
jgi:hypothetical protein